MEKFNFGHLFINMIKTLTNNNESCVQNGGWLSGWYDIQRGVKQGCPVSPLLFLLVVEIMALKIRNNKEIAGLSLSKNEVIMQVIKILQYCDDTTIIVKNEKELAAAIKDIDDFSHISGLELNKTKSYGMWIGTSKHNTDKPGEISWVNPGELIKILGIYFSSMREASDIEKNWETRIQRIKCIMKLWQKRESSVYGKIIICKTFLLSQISYVIQCLSLPVKVLAEIDSLFFKFIWQAKPSESRAREKVKRAVLCRDVENGGLNMIKCSDQQKVFLLKWIQRSVFKSKPSNHNNSKLIDLYFNPMGGLKYISSFNIPYNNITFPSFIPRFWRDAVSALFDLKKGETTTTPESISDILREPLFNNVNIKYKGTTLFFREWVKAGVTNIFHLLQDGTCMSLTQLRVKVGNYGAYFLDFNALWNAVPLQWKRKLGDANPTVLEEDVFSDSSSNIIDTLSKLNNTNKCIRQFLINDTTSICGRMFWKNKMNTDVMENFRIAQEATKESRLRLLHFKILHNILPTNIQLKKMGIKASDSCDFCGELDVVEHMIIYCPILRGYWETVFNTIFSRTNIRLERSDANILFGIRKTDMSGNLKQYRIINHILLIAKMCISKARAAKSTRIDIFFESELQFRDQYLC